MVDYESMTVEQLRAELSGRGLTQSGTKAELIARLQDDDAQQEEPVTDETETTTDPFDGPDAIIDPQTGKAISSTNEPDATGSTSGIPAIGPTDMDGDGQPDDGVEAGQAIKDRYADEVQADAERRGSIAPETAAQGPEQKRRANSLAEALYPNEEVSDEAKEAVAPEADAAHA